MKLLNLHVDGFRSLKSVDSSPPTVSERCKSTNGWENPTCSEFWAERTVAWRFKEIHQWT